DIVHNLLIKTFCTEAFCRFSNKCQTYYSSESISAARCHQPEESVTWRGIGQEGKKCSNSCGKFSRLLWGKHVSLSSALSHASLSGTNDGLSPVCHLELAQDIGDVVAHGLWTQDQALSNLGVAAPLRNQF